MGTLVISFAPSKKTLSKSTPKPALQPEDQVSHLESIEAPAGVSEVSSSIEQGVPQDSLNAMKSRYLAKLRHYVESAKFYPRLAKSQTPILVRVDQKTTYEWVAKLLDHLQKHQCLNVQLVQQLQRTQ